MESRNPQGHRAPTINHLFTYGSLGEGAGMRSLLCKAQRRNGTWAQLAERVGKEEGTQPKRPTVGMVASNSTPTPGGVVEGGDKRGLGNTQHAPCLICLATAAVMAHSCCLSLIYSALGIMPAA